jgi:hypothetical protein
LEVNLMPIPTSQKRDSASGFGQMKLAMGPCRPGKLATAGQYRATNIEVARQVLTDPAANGGEEAGLVRWARLVIAGAEQEAM